MAPKKKTAPAPVSATPWKPRWPCLHEYSTGVGMFRPRKIRWSPLAFFALNPWSAGIMAHFSINNVNFTSMMAGGMFDPLQKFAPPPEFRDAILESYNLVARAKSVLVYGVDPKDEGQHTWTVYNLLGESGKRVYEEALDDWERFFEGKRDTFDHIHELFTLGGAAEPRIVTVPLETLLSPEHGDQAAQALGEHERLGLI